MQIERSYAEALDAADPLAHIRDRFVIDDPDLIYLDGNSLGRLSIATRDSLVELIDQQWGRRLIRGWNEGWFDMANRIGGKLAGIIGAQPHEVLIADSTSVNLYKLAVAGLRYLRQQRPHQPLKIVTDNLNFPSDLYILQSAAEAMGKCGVEIVDVEVEGMAANDANQRIIRALTADSTLLSLTHTTFKSGFFYDMAALTAAAHDAKSLVLWDLSHSAGAVPVDLNGCQVDLAVGCTYKYLNGGPGAPAFLYVRNDLQEQLHNPIAGWFGQKDLFEFGLKYESALGIQRFAVGTPPILSLSAIDASIDLVLEVGMDAIRAKSVAQTDYLISLYDAFLAQLGFGLASPRSGEMRGAHISITHPNAYQVNLAMIDAMNVLPDFRAPNHIRLGIAPLYTRFVDLFDAVQRIRDLVEQGIYEKYSAESNDIVT